MTIAPRVVSENLAGTPACVGAFPDGQATEVQRMKGIVAWLIGIPIPIIIILYLADVF